MTTAADAAVLACIRVPKSGSQSLARMIAEAFPDRTTFYLPDTMRREALISRWQAFRLWRSQTQNLQKHWKVLSLEAALAKIDAAAQSGDLVMGGHFDQPAVQSGLHRPVRSIVLLRDPAERARSDYNYARQGYLKKKPWQRFDAHLTAQIAGRYSFEGFLDYQLEHPQVFGDLACAFVGWLPGEPLQSVLPTIWCWGVLEQADAFARRIGDLAGRPATLRQRNATQRVEQLDISVAERRRIDRLYARDQELYARCRADYS